MNGIFANYLWTMFWGSVFWIMWFFQRKYKYRCIRVYVWSKDDQHVFWMWIWLILNYISLLDIIWSLWLVRFAHSPPNFIFWLGRLIFLVSINSHPDNIYLLWYRNTFVIMHAASVSRLSILDFPCRFSLTFICYGFSCQVSDIFSDNTFEYCQQTQDVITWMEKWALHSMFINIVDCKT